MTGNAQNERTRLHRAVSGLVIVLLAGMALTAPALAAPVFSQRVADPWANDLKLGSDRHALFGRLFQSADNLTLGSPSTVRSVTWWGKFSDNDVPTGPVSFDIVFYADAGNLPDAGSILSYTNVTFASLTDTGEQFGGDGDDDIYVFEADVPPTQLPGGTQVWFSVLADSGSSDDGDFQWRADNGSRAAQRANSDSPTNSFTETSPLDFSFVLDDGQPALAPSHITGVSLAGSMVTLQITNLTVGATHHVLRTDSLSLPSWTTNGSFTTSSATTNWTAAASGPETFYRVKSEN